MTIKTYTQGQNTRTDRELFGIAGAVLVDKKIHEQLGTAITTHPGDLWWLAINSKDELRGFATARAMKGGGLHIRFLWCAEDATLICRTLITRILADAKNAECSSIWTNDRTTAEVWREFGFTPTPKTRGSFCRWEKRGNE